MPRTGVIFHIIEAVANAENVDPLDLPPIFDVINPDAITSFAAAGTQDNSNLKVAFSYCGYRITIHPPMKFQFARQIAMPSSSRSLIVNLVSI